LGVTNLVVAAPHFHGLLVCSTASLVRSIVHATVFELDAHIETVLLAKVHHCQLMADTFVKNLNCLFPSFDPLRQYTTLQAKEYNLSSRLAVMPIERDQLDLSAQEIRDSLALCYRKPMPCLPHSCDGSAPFTVTHSLNCHVGGLVCCRHNEVCDVIMHLVA